MGSCRAGLITHDDGGALWVQQDVPPQGQDLPGGRPITHSKHTCRSPQGVGVRGWVLGPGRLEAGRLCAAPTSAPVRVRKAGVAALHGGRGCRATGAAALTGASLLVQTRVRERQQAGLRAREQGRGASKRCTRQSREQRAARAACPPHGVPCRLTCVEGPAPAVAWHMPAARLVVRRLPGNFHLSVSSGLHAGLSTDGRARADGPEGPRCGGGGLGRRCGRGNKVTSAFDDCCCRGSLSGCTSLTAARRSHEPHLSMKHNSCKSGKAQQLRSHTCPPTRALSPHATGSLLRCTSPLWGAAQSSRLGRAARRCLRGGPAASVGASKGPAACASTTHGWAGGRACRTTPARPPDLIPHHHGAASICLHLILHSAATHACF